MLLQFNVTVIHSHLQIYLDNEFYAKLVFCTVEVKYKLYIELYVPAFHFLYALFGYLITKVDVVILS